ncbi:hypothetical protein ACFE04_022279 [Oxalis oulophora]
MTVKVKKEEEFETVEKEIVEVNSSNKKKRKLKAMLDDESKKKLLYNNRILLCISKPSYVLGIGAHNVRFENYHKLHFLLRKFIRLHNWGQASGVLSVLLQATTRDRDTLANRSKYSASLGLLKHIHGDRDISMRIKHMYDIWSKRIRSTKGHRVEDRLMVFLENMITFLTLGDVQDAHDIALRMKQLNEFVNHPMSYLFMGLTHYQKLYSDIPLQLDDSGHFDSPSTSDMSSQKLVSYPGNYGWQASVSSERVATQFQCHSSVSVNNDQRLSIENNSNMQIQVSMEVDHMLQSGNPPIPAQPLRTYRSSEDSDASFDQVNDLMDYEHCAETFTKLVNQGLDPWLFPLRLPDSDVDKEGLKEMHLKIVNDDYKNAVKYLRLALHSEPPILPALLPLTQVINVKRGPLFRTISGPKVKTLVLLLLIGGQYSEALNEVEKLNSNSTAALPSRLKASIMECDDENDDITLASCFEDTLKKDPTCCHSMKKLIEVHQNGNYNTESLLVTTALHLDGTYAEYSTWRVFAQCFLKVSVCDNDRLSVCLNENADEQRERVSVCYGSVPSLFTKGNSKKSWTVRCKWWMRRHFNKTMLASDSAPGDLQLLAYKAACASHMYGNEFHYVVKARECLQKENSSDLLKFLLNHMKNSIGLYLIFQGRTKH